MAGLVFPIRLDDGREILLEDAIAAARERMACFPGRDERIIAMRASGVALAMVAVEFGLTAGRVRQIQNRVLKLAAQRGVWVRPPRRRPTMKVFVPHFVADPQQDA